VKKCKRANGLAFRLIFFCAQHMLRALDQEQDSQLEAQADSVLI